jgi:hypothetical protein
LIGTIDFHVRIAGMVGAAPKQVSGPPPQGGDLQHMRGKTAAQELNAGLCGNAGLRSLSILLPLCMPTCLLGETPGLKRLAAQLQFHVKSQRSMLNWHFGIYTSRAS